MANDLRTLTYLRNWTKIPQPWSRTVLRLDFGMFQELTTTGLINSRRKLLEFERVSLFMFLTALSSFDPIRKLFVDYAVDPL